jgi:hypothetical protein
MSDDDIIDLVTTSFDAREDTQNLQDLSQVIAVFESIEELLEEHGLSLESEVETQDFEELEVSVDPEEERHELTFILPITDTMLQLEFTYWKSTEGFQVWVDVDFSLEVEDDDEDNE